MEKRAGVFSAVAGALGILLAPAAPATAQGLQPGGVMLTDEAVALCLRPEQAWQDFCNGMMQAYGDIAMLTGRACIPPGTTRRDLVMALTAPEVVVSTGHIDNLPAYETAMEMLIRRYPCR